MITGAFMGGGGKFGALAGGIEIIEPVSVGAIIGGALGGAIITGCAELTIGAAYIWLKAAVSVPAFGLGIMEPSERVCFAGATVTALGVGTESAHRAAAGAAIVVTEVTGAEVNVAAGAEAFMGSMV